MRTVIIAIYLLLYFIFSIPFLGINWIVGKINKEKADLAQLHVVQWGFRCIMCMAGVKLTVNGRDKIPENEPVLYIGNHRGMFDVLATYTQVKGRTGYVSKIAVKKVPVLNLIMTRLYCLFIDRDDMKQSLKVILSAIDYVKQGISIAIFPEGTRCKDPNPTVMGEFKEGSFKIAQKSGCKIVPMAITGTREILEANSPWIHKGKVTVTYGAPIDIKELDKEQQKHIGEYVHGIVQEMLVKACEENA